MRFLVSGGAGFIGSNFILGLMARDGGAEVLNVDKLTYAGNLMNMREVEDNPKYSFVKADICDYESVRRLFESFSPECVVNFAAESHVDRSILDPQEFIRTNIVGAANLMKLSLAGDVKKFIQVSTDEVFGSLGGGGLFTERTPLSPRNPYSASKASAEMLASSYHNTFGLPVCVTRSGNNFGPRQFPEKLIPLAILNLLAGKKVPVYGDGLQVRDWIHVDDNCAAIMAVVERGAVGESYNIGAGAEMRNIDVVRSVVREVSSRTGSPRSEFDSIEHVKDRPGHDRRYASDASKVRSLGWTPRMRFKEGLASTVEWYINNPGWVKSVTTREYMDYYAKNYAGRGVR
jgi:dTDP-glucose 4,6-dehydratase